jgi:hypothetical protein
VNKQMIIGIKIRMCDLNLWKDKAAYVHLQDDHEKGTTTLLSELFDARESFLSQPKKKVVGKEAIMARAWVVVVDPRSSF